MLEFERSESCLRSPRTIDLRSSALKTRYLFTSAMSLLTPKRYATPSLSSLRQQSGDRWALLLIGLILASVAIVLIVETFYIRRAAARDRSAEILSVQYPSSAEGSSVSKVSLEGNFLVTAWRNRGLTLDLSE